MSANKYGNTLTVILIVIIIAVLLGEGILIYNYVIKPHNAEKETAQAITEFDRTSEDQNQEENSSNVDLGELADQIDQAQSGNSGNGGKKKTYYKNFVMIGYITIPKQMLNYQY